MNEYTKEDCKRDTKEHIAQVREFMMEFTKELTERALAHDQSKLESPELEVFTEYTPKLKGSTYGSDEYKLYLEKMGVALKHHYANNSHHPEHYPRGIADMNLFDIVEMFCDWHAATRRHDDGNLIKSIRFNMERFKYSHDLKCIFENTVAKLYKYTVLFGKTDGIEGGFYANSVEELHMKIDAEKDLSDIEKEDVKYGFFREFKDADYVTKNICWDNCFDVYWITQK
jgi:hypothetical protein